MSRKAAHRKSKRSFTIALCVIAKNEERFIADCLDSARAFVDEIVVVDSGSTDRTREIARAHGARVEEFEWCDDFAAARNTAIEHATADWILMLDADERLDAASGPKLRAAISAAPADAHAIAPMIDSQPLEGLGASASTTNVPRIFPRRPEIRFAGAIHEIVTYVPDPTNTLHSIAPEIRLIHYGYDSALYKERDKDARNIALLERAVERQPGEARMLFFLVQQHSTGKRSAEVVAAFKRFLPHAGKLQRAFLVEAYAIYLEALSDLDESEAVEREAEHARVDGVLGAAALNTLAAHYATRGDIDRSGACLQELLKGDLPRGLMVADGVGSWGTHLKLAELAERRGDAPQTLSELQHAFATLPTEKRGVVAAQAAAFATRVRDFAAAAQWLLRARRDAPDTLEVQQELLRLSLELHAQAPALILAGAWSELDSALATEDLQTAFDVARFTSPNTLANLLRLQAVAARLRSVGEREAALIVLNRAMDGQPLPQIYWLLAQTLTELGRYEDASLALTAFEQLQSLPAAA